MPKRSKRMNQQFTKTLSGISIEIRGILSKTQTFLSLHQSKRFLRRLNEGKKLQQSQYPLSRAFFELMAQKSSNLRSLLTATKSKSSMILKLSTGDKKLPKSPQCIWTTPGDQFVNKGMNTTNYRRLLELEVSGPRVGLFSVPVISPIIPNVSPSEIAPVQNSFGLLVLKQYLCLWRVKTLFLL